MYPSYITLCIFKIRRHETFLLPAGWTCLGFLCLQARSLTPRPSDRSSPCSRPGTSVRSTIPSWLLQVTCTQPGGRGWTAVTTAGCPTAASATRSLCPGLSVGGASLACAHSTSMRTKPATQTQLKNLESFAFKVRMWFSRSRGWQPPFRAFFMK